MRLTTLHIALMVVAALVVGYMLGHNTTTVTVKKEGFLGFEIGGSGSDGDSGGVMPPSCGGCGKPYPCSGCPAPKPGPVCPPCREPDMSRYVLKSSVPPCMPCPDMSQYMLKTECPPTPDLSKYVLKSSIPKPQPVIIDSSACKKECGECPPCPRPRCPDVKCAPPTKCPPPAPCPRPVCPPQVVKCRAEEGPTDAVRPFLAPLSWSTFGGGF
jgi:hypothetical protein